MRASETGPVLRVRAIAGTYVVVLAWDFVARVDAKPGLLGFAIHREELVKGRPIEAYWMRGIKRFKDKDRGLPAGTPVSTAEHPVQSFQWGDYTNQTGRIYRYRIVPAYGTVKRVELDEKTSVSVTIETEAEYLLNPDLADDTACHDVYFNRGVIGSQAYARRFGNRAPARDDPTSEEMVWLSRGLFEALTRFIGLAEDHRFSLRAAFYEFKYPPVAHAFAAAIQAGADVKIVYDAASGYREENEAVIREAELDQSGAAIPRTVSTGIRHNKFIVLLKDGEPVAVWTGSTNISDGGIFGHSNVGHIVWSRSVGRAYLDYWQALADDLRPGALRPRCLALSPLPPGRPAPNSITPVFSPRDKEDTSASLQWYADRLGDAREVSCLTLAFHLDKLFSEVLSRDNDVLRYIVKDDDLRTSENIGHDRDVIFAAGERFRDGALANFLSEIDNPLNANNYIHDKFMLIDPLSDDPLIVSGSANFSHPSQRVNDENMIVIRGDTRVADIYFGEFMRIFDHHYVRYVVKKLRDTDRQDPDAGYLKTDSAEWLPAHFDDRSYKSKRRRYLVGNTPA